MWVVCLACLVLALRVEAADFDCKAGVARWHNGWSKAKKDFCCKTIGLGCEATPAPSVTGKIRTLSVKPPSCSLRPTPFDPDTAFHLIECEEQAQEISLVPESVYPLFDTKGLPVDGVMKVRVEAGKAKLVTIRACASSVGVRPTGCTDYKFDIHRKGSSQAALGQLLVSSEGADLSISPPFNPSVTLYRVIIPASSTSTQVIAEAAKDGFVSFSSFLTASHHSESHKVEVPAGVHRKGSHPLRAQWTPLKTVKVYVVSADWAGKLQYTLQIGRGPSSDASLASVASNVGAPYPVGKPEQHRYMLEVPRGTEEVAISATANDKDGAVVTLEGNEGDGYTSAVVKLKHPEDPYELVNIKVQAADKKTAFQYVLVIVMEGHESLAILADLAVHGCVGGLTPHFQVEVHHYRCLLGMNAENVQVTPKGLWMPGFDQQMRILIKGQNWVSGDVFTQQLGDDGSAVVDVVVRASDNIHKATYHISAQGAPCDQRGKLFTTPEPPPKNTPPPPLWWKFTTSTPAPYHPPHLLHGGSSAHAPGAHEIHRPLPWKAPEKVHRFRLPVEEGLTASGHYAGIAGVIGSLASLLALLSSHELKSFMHLLRELQFVAVSSELAGGDSSYHYLTRPFRLFAFQVEWPGMVLCDLEQEAEEVEEAEEAAKKEAPKEPLKGTSKVPEAAPKGPKQVRSLREKRQGALLNCEWPLLRTEAGQAALIWLVLLPIILVLLIFGWLEANTEETLARHSLLSGIGMRGLRLKLLPVALVILDAGLIGLTDALAILIFGQVHNMQVELGEVAVWRTHVPSVMFKLLLLAYPIGFCAFGFYQITRLYNDSFLTWIPVLGHFGDRKCLAVTLRESRYSRPARGLLTALAEAFDKVTELRAAVPICGPNGRVIALKGHTADGRIISPRVLPKRKEYEGFLFAVLPPEEAATARDGVFFRGSSSVRELPKLEEPQEVPAAGFEGLAERPVFDLGKGSLGAWLARREHLGLLSWMERRCAAFDSLRTQIAHAEHRRAITDFQGEALYDCQGQSLQDLYQYCIYQFPWRPWLLTEEGTYPGCSTASIREAYRKGDGILLPWVPPSTGISKLERQLMNDWLSDWLLESEAASAAREELRQLRWCAQADAAGAAEEDQAAVLREMALAVLEKRPFRIPTGTSREAEETKNRLEAHLEIRRGSSKPLPWQQQVDGIGSHEIQAFLHMELIDSEDMPFYDEELVPDFADTCFGQLRLYVRTPGENQRGPADSPRLHRIIQSFAAPPEKKGPWNMVSRLTQTAARITGKSNEQAAIHHSPHMPRSAGTSPAGSPRGHGHGDGHGSSGSETRKKPELDFVHREHGLRWQQKVRLTLTHVELPLRNLELMARWLPAFGFAVTPQNLAMPVAERWSPLFLSTASCPQCNGAPAAATASSSSLAAPKNTRLSLHLDTLERMIAVFATMCMEASLAQEGKSTESKAEALLYASLCLSTWPLLVAFIRFRSGGWYSLAAEKQAHLTRWIPLPRGLPIFQICLSLMLMLHSRSLKAKGIFVEPVLLEFICCVIVLVPCVLRVLALMRMMTWTTLAVFSRGRFLRSFGRIRGWGGLSLPSEWQRPPGLQILDAVPSKDAPNPAFGIFHAVDTKSDGEAIPLSLIISLLGISVRAVPFPEEGGPGLEGAVANERRAAGIRKRLAIFEPLPQGVADGLAVETHDTVARAGQHVRQLSRFREDIYDSLPVVATRAQMVGTEELPELICTVHVVNHVGCSWSCIQNDSLLSLYKPWGLDSVRPPLTSRPSSPRASDDEARHWDQWRHQSVDSPSLVQAWRNELVTWMDEELAAACSVEHGVLDLMLSGGRPNRGALKTEVDKLIAPGIFSDDGLGAERFCDSRCYKEGRVLHYVISASDLKPGGPSPWRPDPLGAHGASLFLASNSSPRFPQGYDDDDAERGNLWRPCLIRLSSRQLTYTMRKADGRDHGGDLPEWTESMWRDHGDAAEYSVPFLFIDRMEVSKGLYGDPDDECLLTLHGRAGSPKASPSGSPTARSPLGSPRSAPGVSQPLPTNPTALTPQPVLGNLQGSPRSPPRHSPRDVRRPTYAPQAMPLVFRISAADGDVWAKIIERYGMFTRPRLIYNFLGTCADHPRVPGLVYRECADGEQLWDDGTRYIGSWEAHTYHGYGQLMDHHGLLIYKGQWKRGLKHGQGTYRFNQGAGGRRCYSGQLHQEEFSGKGELYIIDEDGSLPRIQQERPWAVVRYRGQFSGGGSSGIPEPPNLVLLDPLHNQDLLEQHFPLLHQEGVSAGPRQGPGDAPYDFAADHYNLEGADLQHCGPDTSAQIWYADGTRYFGPCLAGAVPHGASGLLWEKDAGLCFQGRFEQGMRASEGKVSLGNGVVYEGQFSLPGGKRHGNGRTDIPEKLQQRLGYKAYVGEYKDGLRHGQGEIFFTDGTTYRGSFDKNERHGRGIFRSADGSPIYNGPWDQDRPGSGHADIFYADGRYRFKGNVSDGCRDGKGSLWNISPDGDSVLIYRGQWEADEMHGEGELHCQDGLYRGKFSQGLREGRGRFDYIYRHHKQGEDTPIYYEGDWYEDQPNGIGTYVDEYGYELVDREFEMGELVGERRPEVTGFKAKYLSRYPWPTSFLPIAVLPGPKHELPNAGGVCHNAALLPYEEPSQTRPIDEGSGVANGRHHAVHMTAGARWA
eukprot:TRINITY_DN28985_c0_g1_i1.p1 TRINITY_DN28985_c0_g1~~TRINITY_DN28985_c0_g1_i1.p1  ORF type:complete len:2684 (+),score=516.66 TRINITY_DN28985_c0_g1_i1:64-8052(+)